MTAIRNTDNQPETNRPQPGREHTTGDAKDRPAERGYHDSISGRAVTKDGHFLTEGLESDDDNAPEGPIPAHRIVADNWPEMEGNSDKNQGDTTTTL